MTRGIYFKDRADPPLVILTNDAGEQLTVTRAAFEADRATHIAFLGPPIVTPPSAEEELAALKKALIDGGKLTQAELDAASVEVKG